MCEALWGGESSGALLGGPMRLVPLAVAIAITSPLQVNAADIKVLSVGGVQPAISILIP
jgi:hypothetical protein